MPGGATTGTVIGDAALLLELTENDANRVVAHAGHGSTNLGDRERGWSVEQDEVADSVLLGPTRGAGGNPLPETAIRIANSSKQVARPRPQIVVPVVEPADG